MWSSDRRHQANNMVIQGIVILSLLITQALCSPTGCIECSSYVNQFHSQLSAASNHGNLAQSTSQLQGLDYSRPGTWTEHNDYNVNNGKVHEEKGQIVDGLKTVRYFKKNYSSSYGTRNPSGTRLSEIAQLNNNYRHGIYMPSSEDAFDSQRTHNQIGNLESIAQQHDYNRIQSQQHTQSSVRRTNSQSERLEDFGEHSGNSQVTQQSASDLNTQVLQQPSYAITQSGNSYKTNGGQGQAFEEEGQYVRGPKKVRYYKRNYTSSYSSSNGHSVPDIANVEEDNVHRDFENIHRETGVDHIYKDIENIHREIDKSYNQVSTAQGITSSNTPQANINSNGDLNTDSFHRSNSDVYKRRQDYKSNLSNMHHNEQQHHEDIANEYASQQNPSQSTHNTNTYRAYGRREGYVLNPLPSSQYINPTTGYTNVLSTGNSGYNRNMYSEGNLLQQADNLHQVEHLGEHQSSHSQNHMDLDNLKQNTYSQHSFLKPVAPGRVSHYNEQWSSSHREETSLPSYSSGISQISGQNGQYNNQYRENNYNTVHQTKLGKLMTGAMDLSHAHSNDDCTQGTAEQSHISTQYHRIYKRNAKDDKLNNEPQHKHQFDDLTPQTEDLTQRTDDFKDLTQQTSSQIQFEHRRQHSGPQIIYYLRPGNFQPWRPRNANQYSEDSTQQTGNYDDHTQQTTGQSQFGQQTEQTHQPWRPGSTNQHPEDLTQQTGDFDDLTQQTTGHLHFGQHIQQSNQPWKPGSASRHPEDLTQQTGDFDDLTQQTSGKLQLGQQAEQSNQPWRPGSASQHPEDLTQQTGDFDDLTQQTSGKLQLGQQAQQSNQPWKPGSASQYPEDLTQQTGEFDDLTQQTSGKLQFGQETEQSNQPWRSGSASQHPEDLTQQTGDFDDLTQQTSGKLQFGKQAEQSNQPWKPGSASQDPEDLTQQSGDFDDLTQQTSGNLQFGQQAQQSNQPWKPGSASQDPEDLTQQSGDFDDLTQQTSGNLQFGQQAQQSNQPWKPGSASQDPEDLTQQSGDFDDLTQQTSGKLQFGQHTEQSNEPWRPGSASQHPEDLTEQTGDFDDLTQQTSGNLQFGQQAQQSNQPWKPGSASQQPEDLTQQTGDFDDLTQQTSGNLQFGQQAQQSNQPWKPGSASQQPEDLTQQTGDFDDLTQQTSGNLQFGQQAQQSNQPWKPGSASQQPEDLTQQTGDFDDLTQQTSGNLQFGQQAQQSNQPWKPGSTSQHPEDLTQQTGDFDDLTQQTSGNLQFGQQAQQSNQPWRPGSASQHPEDLTQQTGDFDDLTQQTSGNLQLGQQAQQTNQPWKPGSANQHPKDLTQQTGEFDGVTQQTYGKLQFGQQAEQSNQPWRPGSASQHPEDLTQQTGEFDDLTQQTSGKLQFGQETEQSNQSWRPGSASQHSEDLTQQSDNFDDFTQQTTGHLQFGQHTEQSNQHWRPGSANQNSEDLTQQNEHVLQVSDINGSTGQVFPKPLAKPASKPRPRSRYSRVGSVVNVPPGSHNVQDSNNEQPSQPTNPNPLLVEALNHSTDKSADRLSELPPKVVPGTDADGPRSQDIRGDQSVDTSENSDKTSTQKTEGLQWHYTYHPSDRRPLVQQADKRDKGDAQQQSTIPDFHDSNGNTDQQQAQDRYIFEDLYQQSSSPKEVSGLHQQSEDDQEKVQLEFSQQTLGKAEDGLKQVGNNNPQYHLEPRILEAYGGGPYDAFHDENIYDGVTVNPSATLPEVNTADSWDVRAKPSETTVPISEATPPPLPVEPLSPDVNKATPPPTFWSRVGNKLTNTFDKAKEKARSIFG
nr:uncharacterized protein LOC117219849 isoform X2 [Megalopta genalis]